MPCCSATSFTGGGTTLLPRPLGRSGWQTTATTSKSGSFIRAFKVGTANSGVPKKMTRNVHLRLLQTHHLTDPPDHQYLLNRQYLYLSDHQYLCLSDHQYLYFSAQSRRLNLFQNTQEPVVVGSQHGGQDSTGIEKKLVIASKRQVRLTDGGSDQLIGRYIRD